MEPIKFEDNIREKLQEREITPSKTAWEKLEIQLESTPQKRTYKPVWFAIAAGFIGIVVIASFVFKNDVVPLQDYQKIVSEPIQNEVKLPLEEDSNILIAEENLDKVKTKKSLEEVIKSQLKTNSNELVLNEKEKIPSKTKEALIEDIAMNTSENTENILKKEENKEENYIDAKVSELVAQIHILEENNNTVDEEEIDALLLNAQNEINTQKILNKQKVDAIGLLNIVETELETSFRDKVFEALGSGYEKVRTAVVERNN